MKVSWKKIKTILGMNSRNVDYIFKDNPRAYFPRVDDKLLTKSLLKQEGFPVPETYATFEDRRDLDNLDNLLQTTPAFALKPNGSYGGNGVKIIHMDDLGNPTTSSGRKIPVEELEFHIAMILSGAFSVDSTPDKAFMEYLIREPERIRTWHGGTGVSDVRVIVYRGIPAMAMWRLPTEKSDGRANLHAGGVGVGINMTIGKTTTAICGEQSVEKHPDTGSDLSEFQVPHWEQILEISSALNELFELGYLGIDLVFDKRNGPFIIEANARPGLAIQNANRQGLASVLKKIKEEESA